MSDGIIEDDLSEIEISYGKREAIEEFGNLSLKELSLLEDSLSNLVLYLMSSKKKPGGDFIIKMTGLKLSYLREIISEKKQKAIGMAVNEAVKKGIV